MGGLGTRFQKAGYQVPKYMIEVKGKTLFEWAMLSLEGYKSMVSRYIFIVRSDADVNVYKFIVDKCGLLGLKEYNIIEIDYLTDGQAATAVLASEYWIAEQALLIYNIDTYVEVGAMHASQLKGDGLIPCFQAEGNHWSFVKLDEFGKVIEVKEKQRISDYCTIGAYYFRTCQLYEDLYDEYYSNKDNMVNGEKYIAPLYNLMIEKGYQVFICKIDSCKVHVLGTPEEVKRFEEDKRKICSSIMIQN